MVCEYQNPTHSTGKLQMMMNDSTYKAGVIKEKPELIQINEKDQKTP